MIPHADCLLSIFLLHFKYSLRQCIRFYVWYRKLMVASHSWPLLVFGQCQLCNLINHKIYVNAVLTQGIILQLYWNQSFAILYVSKRYSGSLLSLYNLLSEIRIHINWLLLWSLPWDYLFEMIPKSHKILMFVSWKTTNNAVTLQSVNILTCTMFRI